MMNRSEENQNGCREQTRNEDEGIDGILEELMAHVCDELCRFREEMQGDLMDRICGRCGLQQYTDRIREEYEKINNFDKSQTGQLMNRYRKITLCKDCRYRAKNDSGRNIWNSEENITQHLTAGYSHNVPADFYRREVRPWVIHFIKWRSKSRVILLA